MHTWVSVATATGVGEACVSESCVMIVWLTVSLEVLVSELSAVTSVLLEVVSAGLSLSLGYIVAGAS